MPIGSDLVIKAFLSTPSVWRATWGWGRRCLLAAISIHALRVEGDQEGPESVHQNAISIHALRVEGDHAFFFISSRRIISIHALRVEGDGSG